MNRPKKLNTERRDAPDATQKRGHGRVSATNNTTTKATKTTTMLTQIINGRILTPQGWLKDGSVILRDNKILEVTNCDLSLIHI